MPYGDKDPQGGHEDYMFRKVKEFMKNTPITIKLPEGHEFHFKNSEFPTRVAATHLARHNAGMFHSSGMNDDHAKMMSLYFNNSANTHDEMLDAIQRHILNHPNLPEHYKVHVQPTIERLVREHDIDENDSDKMERVGRGMMIAYSPRSNKTKAHPHLEDTAHHLSDVIEDLDNHPDEGYFLRKEHM